VREVLLESVRRRLEADVPLGAFLSGGLDSTAIVACMRRSLGAPPLTYSMGIRNCRLRRIEPGSQDGRAVRDVAHEVPVGAASLQAEIPFVLGRLDEPFADSSALASSIISREARRDLTVSCRVTEATNCSGGTGCSAAWLGTAAAAAATPRGRDGRGASDHPALRQGGGTPGAVRQARRLLEG